MATIGEPQPAPDWLSGPEIAVWNALTSMFNEYRFIYPKMTLHEFIHALNSWEGAITDPNWPVDNFYVRNAADRTEAA